MGDQTRWHASPFSPPDGRLVRETLPAALHRLAGQRPDRPAVVGGAETHSFRDVYERATGIAEQLRDVPGDGPIALIQAPGVDAVAAWFACSMAGRPFLLLEPHEPAARVAALVERAGASAVVCDAESQTRIPVGMPGIRIVPSGRRMAARVAEPPSPDAVLAIFPTSGSTGDPKLVAYATTTLQAKVQASRLLFGIAEGSRVVIAGSNGNFGYLHHALVFLLSGGTLCIADVASQGFSAITDAILVAGARHARFTPSMFRSLAAQPEAAPSLRALDGVRFSGESLLQSDLSLATSVLHPRCRIQNVYGSTESGLCVWTHGESIDPRSTTVPIGRVYPLWDYALRSIDQAATSDPPALEGEAVGELVFRASVHPVGDVEDGRIVSTRFPGATAADDAVRSYATGDVVRRLADGSLVLLGRLGRMVKIRGNRVFLPEVEEQLRRIPGVSNAAVVVAGPTDAPLLYGFVTASPESRLTPSLVRDQLAAHVPAFMLPAQVTVLPEIPRLVGGKVDEEALRRLVHRPLAAADAPSEEDSSFHRLHRLWATVLGVSTPDLDADFHALGGDSLRLFELQLAIHRDFGVDVPTAELLVHPTLRGLAARLGISPMDAPHVGHSAPTLTSVRLPPAGRQPHVVLPSARSGRTVVRLRARHVREAEGDSLGVVAVMPGWLGPALVHPIMDAGWFPDHSVWAIDAQISTPTILARESWLLAAQEIAAAIRRGSIPTPDILVGISISGYIAWTVGRLLAGTSVRPAHVILLDSTPLHRVDRYSTRQLRQSLVEFPLHGLPAGILLRRAAVPGVVSTGGKAQLWQTEDNIASIIDLPTVTHEDFWSTRALAQYARAVDDAVNSAPQRVPDQGSPAPIFSFGGTLFDLATGRQAADEVTLSRLGSFLPYAPSRDLRTIALLFLLRHADVAVAAPMLSGAIRRAPESLLIRYALARSLRHPRFLVADQSESQHPTRRLLRDIDTALLAQRTGTVTTATTLRRYGILLLDLTGSVLSAATSRLRRVWSRLQRRSRRTPNPPFRP